MAESLPLRAAITPLGKELLTGFLLCAAEFNLVILLKILI
jgi:hypothetical protein